ncbi:MAG: Unknown protein [uncultured Sulfurovum sp.]|uniref:Uncharacterized protein n=1 Tax=uncultured Sulfurovum sp. TaxID=269237 RepID=A0A6S6TVK3_9BACT|nr:MAG: Unknown protein [uncultured Sulfurovum sp.]
MTDKEYEEAKAERDRLDKKRSMIMFPLLFLVIIGGLVYIVMNR